jgi:hypothetical protein
MPIPSLIPSKNQARSQLLGKDQSRSIQEFGLKKAQERKFQASLALLSVNSQLITAPKKELLVTGPAMKIFLL